MQVTGMTCASVTHCSKMHTRVVPVFAAMTLSICAAALPWPCCCCCCCRTGVLSTISSHPGSAGFPFGSVVEFAVDAAGHPLLSTSTLSPHTADLQADGRCSITVMAPGFTVGVGFCWQQQRPLALAGPHRCCRTTCVVACCQSYYS